MDNDNNVDVSVYQGDVKQKSCGTLQLTYGLEQSDQIYTLICSIEGDTVKLTKNSDVIVVYEIGVTSTGIFSKFKASSYILKYTYLTYAAKEERSFHCPLMAAIQFIRLCVL